MSYSDPYGQRPVSYANEDLHYGDDHAKYSNYEQAGTSSAQPYRSVDLGAEKSGYSSGPGMPRPTTQFSIQGRPISFVPPKDIARDGGFLRLWRKENRASWVKGGGFRTCCRMFSGCFLTFLAVLISVVLTILLYVRPPDINLNSVSVPTSNAVALTNSGLTINVNLNVSVTNPNWFGVSFEDITAVAFYPGNSNKFGGGSHGFIKFDSNALTSFIFPFQLNYTTALDPDKTILNDIVARCKANTNLNVNYDLTLKMKIVVATISPTISNSASFACPAGLSSLAGQVGL